MKILNLLLPTALGLSFFLTACKKSSNTNNNNNTNSNTTMIVGRWSIVNDTLSNNNYTNDQGYPVPGNYIGVPADYWEFLENGQVKVHGNNHDDSSTYQILPDGRLDVAGKADFKNALIEDLSAHSCTIYGSDTSSTNGGFIIETLNLKR